MPQVRTTITVPKGHNSRNSPEILISACAKIEQETPCKACNGTGKASNGHPCFPCGGKGRKERL